MANVLTGPRLLPQNVLWLCSTWHSDWLDFCIDILLAWEHGVQGSHGWHPLSLFSPLLQGSNFNLKLFKGRFCAKLWFEKDSELKDSYIQPLKCWEDTFSSRHQLALSFVSCSNDRSSRHYSRTPVSFIWFFLFVCGGFFCLFF